MQERAMIMIATSDVMAGCLFLSKFYQTILNGNSCRYQGWLQLIVKAMVMTAGGSNNNIRISAGDGNGDKDGCR